MSFALMNLNSREADDLFDKSFGGAVKHEGCYFDPSNKLDKLESIREALIEKASIDTQTGGVGTAGTAMVPVHLSSDIVDRTDKDTPLRNIFRRVATKGLTFDYVPLTAKGGAAFHAENAAIAVQNDTYDRVSIDMKFLYARGRVSGPAIAAMRGSIDPQSLDLRVKVKSIAEAEENAIINGNVSTDVLEFNGLIATITTNTTQVSGFPTLSGIRAEYTASFNNQGRISLAVTDMATHNYIKGLLQSFQRQPAPPAEGLPFGIPGAFSIDGVNYIPDRFMPTTSTARRILFLDERYIFMGVLQDMTYEELGQTHDARPEYLLKEYLALVVTHEAACTQMYDIS